MKIIAEQKTSGVEMKPPQIMSNLSRLHNQIMGLLKRGIKGDADKEKLSELKQERAGLEGQLESTE